jgi:predicted TIM-barrel fold metal-dependent hydrolase
MKYSLTFAWILVLTGGIYSQAEDALPPKYNFNRYAKMMDKSPFAVATAVAAPAATPDFAKDLYIANAARSQDGDMVTIASTADHNFKKYLTTREPVDGYSIANIEWSDKVGATKVTISKDGNFATLTFNQALLSQTSANGGAMARAFTAPGVPVPNPVGRPNMHSPNLPPNVPPELQQLIPSRDSMQPRTRGMIQRNPRASRGPGGDSAAKQ